MKIIKTISFCVSFLALTAQAGGVFHLTGKIKNFDMENGYIEIIEDGKHRYRAYMSAELIDHYKKGWGEKVVTVDDKSLYRLQKGKYISLHDGSTR